MTRTVATLALALVLDPAGAQGIPADARSGADPQLRQILVRAIAEADSFEDRFDAEV